MKKTGFTLAEVLITLGVLGVVAAMTMPSLTVNTQKAHVGPALAKAINTLENANRMILQDNDARSLESVCGTDYISCLRERVDGTLPAGNHTIRGFANNETAQTLVSQHWLQSKDNLIYGQTGRGSNMTVSDITANDDLRERYSGRLYDVYIDTNGTKGPNALGRDVYRFMVDTSGSVIAFGGTEDVNDYRGDNGQLWSFENNCDGGGVNQPASCAGSVVDNGFRVIHF